MTDPVAPAPQPATPPYQPSGAYRWITRVVSLTVGAIEAAGAYPAFKPYSDEPSVVYLEALGVGLAAGVATRLAFRAGGAMFNTVVRKPRKAIAVAVVGLVGVGTSAYYWNNARFAAARSDVKAGVAYATTYFDTGLDEIGPDITKLGTKAMNVAKDIQANAPGWWDSFRGKTAKWEKDYDDTRHNPRAGTPSEAPTAGAPNTPSSGTLPNDGTPKVDDPYHCTLKAPEVLQVIVNHAWQNVALPAGTHVVFIGDSEKFTDFSKFQAQLPQGISTGYIEKAKVMGNLECPGMK